MDEKELKTSPKQRIFIIFFSLFMVGSIVASYAAIVISGSQSGSSSQTGNIDEAKVAEYQEAYEKVEEEFAEATKGDFDKFIKYKSDTVKAYNESSANENGVVKNDIVVGTGAEISGDDYLAYYIGWCADETVFDSSFDNNDNPTSFAKILDPSLGMIEGWNTGVEGMKLEGIREITVPGSLAYGESREICGGTNKPLKFMVMAKEKTDSLSDLSKRLDDAYMRYQYSLYGIDYDSVSANAE